jgi:hypothetical protein
MSSTNSTSKLSHFITYYPQLRLRRNTKLSQQNSNNGHTALKTRKNFLSLLNNRGKLIKFKLRTEAETSVRLELFHTYTEVGRAREGVAEGRKTIVLFWASPDATMTTREMRKWSSGR